MNVVLQFTAEEEEKALPILLRHSAGTILPNGTYAIGPAAAQTLRDQGIGFREISPPSNVPVVADISIGVRI
jgi:hypothetical protein